MDKTFTELTDRARLDRLKGEILAFVSDFEAHGYTNLEIARELVGAAFERAWREPRNYLAESFYQHVHQVSGRLISESEHLIRESAAEHAKSKIT